MDFDLVVLFWIKRDVPAGTLPCRLGSITLSGPCYWDGGPEVSQQHQSRRTLGETLWRSSFCGRWWPRCLSTQRLSETMPREICWGKFFPLLFWARNVHTRRAWERGSAVTPGQFEIVSAVSVKQKHVFSNCGGLRCLLEKDFWGLFELWKVGNYSKRKQNQSCWNDDCTCAHGLSLKRCGPSLKAEISLGSGWSAPGFTLILIQSEKLNCFVCSGYPVYWRGSWCLNMLGPLHFIFEESSGTSRVTVNP